MFRFEKSHLNLLAIMLAVVGGATVFGPPTVARASELGASPTPSSSPTGVALSVPTPSYSLPPDQAVQSPTKTALEPSPPPSNQGNRSTPVQKWPIFVAKYSALRYELVNNVTPTLLSVERWKSEYASAAPQETDTSYVKYSWSPTIYAVTRWPGGSSAWQWQIMTYNEQRRVGFPSGSIVPWVGGTDVYRWATSAETFFAAPDGRRHKVTQNELSMAGSPTARVIADEGFIKLPWAGEVFRMTSLTEWVGSQASWADQKADDNPTPMIVASIPGQSFAVMAGTKTVQFQSTLLSRPITYTQWRNAGFPLEPTSKGELTPTNPDDYVNVGGATYTAQSADVDHAIRVGPDYARFEVRSGENRGPVDGSLERAELAKVGLYPRSTPLWGAMDVKITGDVSKTWTGGGPNISQLYAGTEPGEKNKTPPLAFKVTPLGALEVQTRGDVSATTKVSPPTVVRASVPNANSGRIIRIVYRVLMDPVAGELDVWIDGKRLVTDRNVSIGYNDSTEDSKLQFKYGQYRSHTDATIVTEFANVDFGTTSLMDRVRSIEPWPSAR